MPGRLEWHKRPSKKTSTSAIFWFRIRTVPEWGSGVAGSNPASPTRSMRFLGLRPGIGRLRRSDPNKHHIVKIFTIPAPQAPKYSSPWRADTWGGPAAKTRVAALQGETVTHAPGRGHRQRLPGRGIDMPISVQTSCSVRPSMLGNSRSAPTSHQCGPSLPYRKRTATCKEGCATRSPLCSHPPTSSGAPTGECTEPPSLCVPRLEKR
jgi:hypothetical protein